MNTTPSFKRMTKRKLLEALKQLLESPEIKISAGNLKREHGITFYDRDKETDKLIDIKITIDSRNAPVISTMVHELLHVYMAQQHQIDRLFVDTLEEAIVEGLANELTKYLHEVKNRNFFNSWVKSVEEKLK